MINPRAVVAAVVALPLGYGAGLVYFRALRASVVDLPSGTAVLGAMARRLGAVTVLLVLAALAGAPALLAAAAGLLLGRARVMRAVAAEPR